MASLSKIIKKQLQKIDNSNQTFEDIFKIIHSQEGNIFCELTNGYKIVKLTYKDIKEQAIKMANHFKEILRDEPYDSFVGLMMENSPLWVASFWGLLMAGYKPMLINIRLGSALNNDVVKILNINKVIADSDYVLDCEVISVKDIDINAIELKHHIFKWANAMAVSTSATTLNIKVCVYEGHNIAEQLKNTRKIVKDNPSIKGTYKGELKLMAFLPFYHVFGLIATYFWFSIFGRTLVFLKDYSNDTILKTARKHKVTHIFAVPMVWNAVCKAIEKEVKSKDEKTRNKFYKGIDLSIKLQSWFPRLGAKITRKLMAEVQNQVFGDSIRFLITGGGYISPHTLKIINGIGYPLYNGYGMSEIGITSVELRRKAKYRILETIGEPFESVQYKIEDEKLYVKGKSICSTIISKKGIYNNNYDEWFATNDLAEKDSKGYYYILGRNDDVIVSSNGEKINPDSIEKNMNFAYARRFCVLAYKENEIDYLTLIVEINAKMSKLKTSKLLEETLENARKHNIEKIYFTADKIAADTAIKVSRSILLSKIAKKDVNLINYNDLNDNSIDSKESLNDELILELKKIFGEILLKDDSEIDVNGHFIFDLGGSSLEYLSLLVKLKEVYEIEFSTTEGACYSVVEFSKFIMKSEGEYEKI